MDKIKKLLNLWRVDKSKQHIRRVKKLSHKEWELSLNGLISLLDVKYKEALNKKFGGWSCYYCGQLRYNNKLRPGQQVAYDQLKENSKYYKKIYDKKLNKEMELQGVKVTNY